WEGFCTSGGELVNIGQSDRGRRIAQLEPGDYGSISRGDLRILFKIAPLRKTLEKTKRMPRSYRQSIFTGFIRGSSEKAAALAAVMFLAIGFRGVVSGFYYRGYHKPTKIDHLADNYVVPFVSADHLLHSPEALQGSLDRRDYLRSTMAFYRSLTSVMMGWSGFDNRHVFPSTAELYRDLYRAVGEKIRDFREQQANMNQKVLNREQSVLSIPAVVGESQAGSILRLIDKMDLAHQSYAM